jgi:hypothetical protein
MEQPKKRHVAWPRAALAITLALAGLSGCAASAQRTAAVDARQPAASIALPSENAILLGAIDGEEAYRNDPRMGSPTPGGFVVESVEREWYQRDRILSGRSYLDTRFTTRVRERSIPWRP